MQNVTQEFKNAFLSGSQKYLILSFEDEHELKNKNILSESMLIEQTLCDEEQLKFGKCSANVFKINIYNDDKKYIGLKFDVEIRCGDFVKKLGTFRVKEENKSPDKLTKEIVAYDQMYDIANTNVADWYNNLDFGTISEPKQLSIKTIRDSLFNYLGIKQKDTVLINDNLLVEKTIEATTISGLDMIESICEINGVFGNIDFDNQFCYVNLKIPESYEGRNFNPEDYCIDGLEYEDFITATIGRVQIKENSDDVGYGYGSGNTYSIVNNLFTLGKSKSEKESIAKTILNQIKNVYYTPVIKLEMPSAIWLDLGDFIQVTSIRQEKISFPILNRQISGITALRDNFSARGTEEYTEELNGLQRDIQELKSKTTTIKETTDGVVKTVSQIEENYYDKNDLENDLDNYYNNNLKGELDNLQEQIDGTKQTYTGTEVPTLKNYPANTWDIDEKRRHVGCVYYDGNGNGYRFVYNIFIYGYVTENGNKVPRYLTNNGKYLVEYLWKKLSSDEVSKALADSAKALNDLGILENKVITEYYTKTQTDKIITDEIDEISTELSKNYYTKAHLDGEYKVEFEEELASKIKQTSSEISMAVQSITKSEYDKIEVGAENLILNSEDMIGNTHFLINAYLKYQGKYLTYKGKYLVI